MPAPTEVIRVWKCLDIEVFQKGQPQLDFTAMRQVGLLYDYEDRLIRVEHGFTHLHLYTTSIQDWVVSALHGEDFDFVFTCSLVTGEVLDWVADNMDKYCGMRPFADKTLERLLDGIK
jgi:hypothetical protein